MNARANLITAALTLALIGPAAAGASSRNIPGDASLPKKQPAVHLHTLKANTSTTGTGAYNAQAYVYGGASTKVAKAITNAGAQRQSITTHSQWAYVPGGASEKVAKAITRASRPR